MPDADQMLGADGSPVIGPTLGLEIEMPLADRRSGASFDGRALFARLAASRAPAATIGTADQITGVVGRHGLSSIDNGFNNLESSIGPVGRRASDQDGRGLAALARLVWAELNEIIPLLAEAGGAIINFAEHPATVISPDFYRAMRAPKPIYDYWIAGRGWRHDQGIDAKAQNGPTTGVAIDQAIEALNLTLLVAPVMVALFANSPFEAGALTGLKENRLTLWPRMFAAAHMPWDRQQYLTPARPFNDLGDYFRWMHGPGTAMQALPTETGSYKGYAPLMRVAGDPDLISFLSGPPVPAQPIDGTPPLTVCPSSRHFEQLQFAHFLDARIRFAFTDEPPLTALIAALRPGGDMDRFMAEHCAWSYIEGRACGALFPDRELLDLDNSAIAASAILAPSALQKGLLAHPTAWQQLSAVIPWSQIGVLKQAAMADGLDGVVDGLSLRSLAELVFELASDGLLPPERWMLAYVRHGLDRGETGADRAIQAYERTSGSSGQRLQRLISRRLVRELPPLP